MIRRRTGRKSKNVRVNFLDTFEELKKNLHKKASQVVAEGFEAIVNGTPVETGYARANWSVVIKGEDFPTPLFKSEYGFYPSADDVSEEGIAKIFSARKDGFLTGLSFYNPVPYMGRLEHGYSSQNKYFVRSAVFKMKKNLSGFKKKGY